MHQKNQFFWGVFLVQVHQFGTGTRYVALHKCGKKVETIIQKIFGSDPYVGSSYSGKTGRGGLFVGAGGDFSKLSKRWHIPCRGKFLRGKVFAGESFCHPANISSLFINEKFFSDTMNIFDLSWECSKCPI